MTDDEILKLSWEDDMRDYNGYIRTVPFARALLAAGASEGQAEPVAWYIPDEDGRPFKTTGYSYDAAQWKYAGATVEPLYTHPSAEIAALRERIAGMEKDAERWRAWLPIRDHYRWDVCSEKEATQIVDDTIAEQKETKQ